MISPALADGSSGLTKNSETKSKQFHNLIYRCDLMEIHWTFRLNPPLSGAAIAFLGSSKHCTNIIYFKKCVLKYICVGIFIFTQLYIG